jgi:hypothetical protein
MPQDEAKIAGILEAEGMIPELAVAKGLENSVRTLRRWDELGIGPARVKLGKKIYYRRAAISKWIADQEKKHKR